MGVVSLIFFAIIGIRVIINLKIMKKSVRTQNPGGTQNFAFPLKNAFTLIELLVVIAIIGILATLAVVALQQARQNARDSKRMADIKQIHTALELFYYENGRYPTSQEWNSGLIKADYSDAVFMHNIPFAPTPADGSCTNTSNTYTYTPLNNESSYTIDFCTGKQVLDLPAGQLCLAPGGIMTCGDESVGGEDGGGVVTCSTYLSGNGECEYGGQTYQIVQIGSQTWFAENLNIGTRINGNNNQIENGIIEKFCYDNLESNCNIYGGLYQWNEAMQYVTTERHQGICPNGWHVPSDNDWTVLTDYIIANIGATTSNVARWLKSCRQVDNTKTSECLNPLEGEGTNTLNYPRWDAHSTHYGINAYGFNILPAGWFAGTGFSYINSRSFIWSSSLLDDNVNAYLRYLYSSFSSVFRGYYSASALGFSVRCLKTD